MGARPSHNLPKDVQDWETDDVRSFFACRGLRLEGVDGVQLREWHARGILRERLAPQRCGLSFRRHKRLRACEDLQRHLAINEGCGLPVEANVGITGSLATGDLNKAEPQIVVTEVDDIVSDAVGPPPATKELESGSGTRQAPLSQYLALKNASPAQFPVADTLGTPREVAGEAIDAGTASTKEQTMQPPLESIEGSAKLQAIAAAHELREQAKQTLLKAGAKGQLGTILAQIKQRKAVNSIEQFRQQANMLSGEFDASAQQSARHNKVTEDSSKHTTSALLNFKHQGTVHERPRRKQTNLDKSPQTLWWEGAQCASTVAPDFVHMDTAASCGKCFIKGQSDSIETLLLQAKQTLLASRTLDVDVLDASQKQTIDQHDGPQAKYNPRGGGA